MQTVRKKAFILVADRNPHIRSLLCRMLSERGYIAQQARDGREVNAFLRCSDPPLAVVLDPDIPYAACLDVACFTELPEKPDLILYTFTPDEGDRLSCFAALTVEKNPDTGNLMRVISSVITARRNSARGTPP